MYVERDQDVMVPDTAAELMTERERGHMCDGLVDSDVSGDSESLRREKWLLDLVLMPLATARTADEIAELMRTRGDRGQRHARSCPIAHYLARQIPGDIVVEVDKWQVAVKLPTGTHAYVAPVTGAMADFVRRFDAGVYPDLVA